MKIGDIVVCRDRQGYPFTEGKEYVVLDYDPEMWEPEGRFTWPAYVKVMGDDGHTRVAHAHRFVVKEN